MAICSSRLVGRFERYLAVIAGIAFQLPHIDRAVEFDAIAGFHAGGRAGSSTDGRKRRPAQQDLQRLVGFLVRQGIEEALYIIAGRADVIARRNHLLAVWLLARPWPCLDRRQAAFCAAAENCGRDPCRAAATAVVRRSPCLRRFEKPDFLVRAIGRSQVRAFEAEMLERGAISCSGNASILPDGAGERRVDDGHAASAQVVVTRNAMSHPRSRCGCAGNWSVKSSGGCGELSSIQPPALSPADDLCADQGRVEHDDVIGLVDQVAIGNGFVGVAAKRLDRCAGTFCGIQTESLNRLAL